MALVAPGIRRGRWAQHHHDGQEQKGPSGKAHRAYFSVSILKDAPVERITIVPSWSVRYISALICANRRSTGFVGCPYWLPAPAEMTATFGLIFVRNGRLDEAFDPWCPTF